MALRMAADMLGGPRKLRHFLKASSADVANWLSGVKQPPTRVFLAALELILDDLDSGGHQLRKVNAPRRKSAAILKARKPTLK
jgi:hypothetical protein